MRTGSKGLSTPIRRRALSAGGALPLGRAGWSHPDKRGQGQGPLVGLLDLLCPWRLPVRAQFFLQLNDAFEHRRRLGAEAFNLPARDLCTLTDCISEFAKFDRNVSCAPHDLI